MAQQSSDGNTIAWSYDQGGKMLGFTLTQGIETKQYFYIRNLQGDVVAVLDTNGIIVAEYSYDAWGRVTSAEGPMAGINPIRYRGYYYDNETGYYYCQSRYYNPQWCRWISADVLMDTADGIMGTNMYAYCLNDPVNLCDSTGMYTATAVFFDAYTWVRELPWDVGRQAAADFTLANSSFGNLDGDYPFAEIALAVVAAGVGAYGIYKFKQAMKASKPFAVPEDKISFDGTNKNKVFNGSKNHGGHDWSPFGQDSKGDPIGAWEAITAIIINAMTKPDYSNSYSANGGQVWTFVHDLADIGFSVVVTAFEKDGIFKVSDAWPQLFGWRP